MMTVKYRTGDTARKLRTDFVQIVRDRLVVTIVGTIVDHVSIPLADVEWIASDNF